MLAEKLKITLDKAGIHYAWVMANSFLVYVGYFDNYKAHKF